jgi:hypothetical protein
MSHAELHIYLLLDDHELTDLLHLQVWSTLVHCSAVQLYKVATTAAQSCAWYALLVNM